MEEETKFTDYLKGSAKAGAAFLVGGLTVLYTALADGAVSPQEWVGVLLGALGTPAAVWTIPNKTEVSRNPIEP